MYTYDEQMNKVPMAMRAKADPPKGGSSGGMSKGTIIGLVIGAALLFIVLAVVFFGWKKGSNDNPSSDEASFGMCGGGNAKMGMCGGGGAKQKFGFRFY